LRETSAIFVLAVSLGSAETLLQLKMSGSFFETVCRSISISTNRCDYSLQIERMTQVRLAAKWTGNDLLILSNDATCCLGVIGTMTHVYRDVTHRSCRPCYIAGLADSVFRKFTKPLTIRPLGLLWKHRSSPWPTRRLLIASSSSV